jgi:putative FmdB family regulatory protein
VPIYEYRCQHCGHQLEVIQKFSDLPLTSCENCGKNTLEKMVSLSAFQLKGTGWYVTDFKNSQPNGREKNEVATSTKEGSSESKTDTKSDSSTKEKT